MVLACIWGGLGLLLATIALALLAGEVAGLRMDLADQTELLRGEFAAMAEVLPARIKPFNPASAPTPVQGRHSA